MTFAWPESLFPLRDHLKKHGVATDRHGTARQAAFFAQQLIGSRIKFPPQGEDMMPTLFLIQAAIDTKGLRDYRAPKREKPPKTTKKGENLKTRPSFDADAVETGVHIFCDGAAVPNPGAGGWGVVVYEDGREIASTCGGDAEATNNQMELTGLLNAIVQAKRLGGRPATIWCDSQYAVKGVNEWRHGWKAKGWNRGGPDAKPENRILMNADLWKAIDEEISGTAFITVRWVKGHAGVAGNERADELAEQGRQQAIERAEAVDHSDGEADSLDGEFRAIMAG